MTALSVNLNKVALLRNSREGTTPSVLEAARAVIAAGAHGITVHPRPDQRHVRPSDVTELAELLGGYDHVEYNIEGNPMADARDNGYPGFDALIAQTQPHQATLVPDTDGQLTSDHGWDLTGDQSALREKIVAYQSLGARVSLFMDPDVEQIERAAEIGADRIELYTGPFAEAFATGRHTSILEQHAAAAAKAAALGLGINAGHDLDLDNLPTFLTIPAIAEVSIGHALIGHALHHGLSTTVAAYVAIVDAARTDT